MISSTLRAKAMFNNLRQYARRSKFLFAVLLGLLLACPVSAQISIAVDSDGSSNINLGPAGPNKSINFFIGQDSAASDDLAAIFAVVDLSGGVVADPAGIVSAQGAGTAGYFGAGNLVVSTIGPGDSNSQFEVNQFFGSSQPIMTGANRELWFTLNVDTTGLAAGDYSISLADAGGSFRDSAGAFIAANNNLSFTVSEVLLGDVNLDGVVNFLDIAPFIGVLSGNTFQAEADVNLDGTVNFLDIAPFISILSGG
jgi:hypothetical protein